jgi:UDP-glucose 4-epimerase
VGDIVDALIALSEHPDAIGKVFNIGHNQEVTIRELAERVISLTHSRSSIRMIPYDQAYEAGFEDMHRRIPSLERIQKLIGYKPTKTLDQILEAIIRSQSEKPSTRPRLASQPTSRLAE